MIAQNLTADLVLVFGCGSGFGLFSWSFCRCISQSHEHVQAIQHISQSYFADLATLVLSQVNEVVTKEIRAVSHFFSNSEARFVASPF